MSVLRVDSGDDRVLDVAVTEDGEPDGPPQDLTGMSLRFTAKHHRSDPDDDAVIVKVTPTEIEIDGDPTTGLATITIDAADTADLFDVRLAWDLQARDSEDKTKTLAKGTLYVRGDVSQTSP